MPARPVAIAGTVDSRPSGSRNAAVQATRQERAIEPVSQRPARLQARRALSGHWHQRQQRPVAQQQRRDPAELPAHLPAHGDQGREHPGQADASEHAGVARVGEVEGGSDVVEHAHRDQQQTAPQHVGTDARLRSAPWRAGWPARTGTTRRPGTGTGGRPDPRSCSRPTRRDASAARRARARSSPSGWPPRRRPHGRRRSTACRSPAGRRARPGDRARGGASGMAGQRAAGCAFVPADGP